MTKLTLTIPGPARGKARPRVVNQKGVIRTYTPDPGGWVRTIRYTALHEWGMPLWEGPIGMAIEVHRAIPKGWSKAKRQELEGAPCESTPDAINIGAAICDVLESILYLNDKQVASISCLKVWGLIHETIIEVWRMGDE